MRHFKTILLAAAGAAIAMPAAAQDSPSGPQTQQQVAKGPPPAWVTPSEPLPVPPDASGLAFLRVQDTVLHLDSHGQSTYVGQRLKLLHPQSLQIGNLAIAWNPASGTPTIHAVKVHRGSETIDVLDKTAFEVLRREDQLEQAMLSGTLTAVLKVPDLRVGDELEVAYTLPSSDPTLRNENAGILVLPGTTLPGRYHLAVSWEQGEEPRINTTRDFGTEVIRSANAVDIRADNPATLVPPKDAPPRYNWQRLIEYSDFAGWDAISQRFAGLFTDAAKLGANSPLKQEAARIAAEQTDPLARAQEALALVQQQVRYIYIGLDGGNFLPASADETWRRRYGDCKAKTALLLALLGELGIAAEPVLVQNGGADDGFDARLPNPGLFDHVLVRATIDGKKYWLDGTLPVIASASLAPDFPYRWVLPLTAKGSALENIAWAPAEKPEELNLYEIDARAGIDAPARIVTTSIKRGPDALAQYVQFSALTADQLLQAFRSNLTGESSWNSIDSVTYRFDPGERASVLEIAGTGPVDWDIDGAERSLALPGGGFSPPGRRQRAADQDQAAPFYDEPSFNCYVTTLRLPKDTDPENWRFNSMFDTSIYGHVYYRAFDRRDGSLRLVRGSRTERPEIDPVSAARDNERLARFDNSMAWATYDPDRTMKLPASFPKVAATYEGDWLHSAEACLPKDLH